MSENMKKGELYDGASSETWDESKHPRVPKGNEHGGEFTKKMTPAEKIASVHIDFDRDNILPELNEDSLEKIGLKENKPVLVKASTILRNSEVHSEVSLEDINSLIGKTLYSSDLIVPGKNSKGQYFTFAKNIRISRKNGKPIYGIVLLDVSAVNNNFEVVHWHWVKENALKSIFPKK